MEECRRAEAKLHKAAAAAAAAGAGGRRSGRRGRRANADMQPQGDAEGGGAEGWYTTVFPSLMPAGRHEVALLERHPYSSQLFVPLNAPRRYLVVVALPAAEPPGVDVRREGAAPPDMTTLRAFMARRDQGVNYAAGVWHHPLAALDDATDFACVVYEDGSPDDCHVLAMGDVGPGAPVVVRIVRDAGGEAVSRL